MPSTRRESLLETWNVVPPEVVPVKRTPKKYRSAASMNATSSAPLSTK